MSFYNLYAFVCTKIMQDLSQILLVLIVDYFSSILWRKDDMVLAQPFGMCSTISLWHEITFPFSVVAWTPLLYGKVISLLNDLSPPAAKRTKRVGASSRVRGRELSYEVRSIRLHHPMSGLNLPPFSAARAFCISPQYFHPLALPLTVPLQKAALVSACSTTRKPLLFVSLCLDLYDL